MPWLQLRRLLLQPGESCRYRVTYLPHAGSGSDMAVLRATESATTYTIAVTGQASD